MSFFDKLKSFFTGSKEETKETTPWPFPVGPESTVVVDPVPTIQVPAPKVTEGKTKGGTGAVKKPKATPKPSAPKAAKSSTVGATVAKVNQPKPAVKAKSVKAKPTK